MTAAADTFVDAGVLEVFVADLLDRAGMPSDDAAFTARCLVQTNLWGIDSHGVLRVPVYVQRLLNGAVNPTPKLRIARGDGAFEILDGDDGMGFVVARAAMLRAVEHAGEHGLGAVGVVNSNHFGAAGIYARLAVERGMIGIAMSNVVAKVVAPGGSKAITGNNPLAIAIPTFGDFPFVLDMSLSAVAGGKLLLASKKGDKIPLGWATDANGRPTDDPDVAFGGFYLPMGGIKGLGLSYVVDILCGLITGGPFGTAVKSMYAGAEPTKTGHMMIAMNVAAIMGPEQMQARMGEFVAAVKSSPMWDESAEMLVPGEIEHRAEQQRRESGIPLPPKLLDELRALGQQLGSTAELLVASTTP